MRRWSCRGSRPRGSRSVPICSRLVPWEETDDPVELVADARGRAGDRRDRRPHVGPVRARAASPTAAHDVPEGERRHRSAPRREGRGGDRRAAASRARPPTAWRRSCRRATSRLSAAPRPRSRRTSPAGSSPKATITSTSPSSARDRTRRARTTTPPSRVIQAGEVVLCDFGGTMRGSGTAGAGIGYCSDITRCVWTGGR